jgi:hypothetical protein
MDRKEFLIQLWKKGIKPLILIVLLYFSIRFIINIFKENSTERLVTILVIGFLVVSIILTLIGILFRTIIEKIHSKLPESVKTLLRITGKIINYLIPFILGIIIYKLWEKDWVMASFYILFFFFEPIRNIIKGERSTKNNLLS